MHPKQLSNNGSQGQEMLPSTTHNTAPSMYISQKVGSQVNSSVKNVQNLETIDFPSYWYFL